MTYPEQYTIFLVVAPIAAAISIGLLFYARSRYPSTEVTLLTVLMAVVIAWLVLNWLELAANTEADTLTWSKLSYGFITFTAVAWLAFALQFTGYQQWLTPRRFIFFCIIPTITTLLAWSNDLHHLLWRDYHFLSVNGVLALNVDYGPWFWVHAIHSYGLVTFGAFLILRKYFRSFKLYRQQSTWLAIGSLTPLAINAFYIFQLVPAIKKDFTPIGLAFASVAFAIGMIRYHLFDLKPVAREAVVDSMSDGMLAIDMRGRIIDINPAAEATIGIKASDAIGRLADEVLSPWRDQAEPLRDAMDVRTEISVEEEGVTRHFDLQISPLLDRRGQPNGRLIVWRDMTRRKQIEAELRRYTLELEARNEELDAFAHTVAHDLKNPLTTLLALSNFLQSQFQSMSSTEVMRILGTMGRNAQKMDAIINALLLLASVRKVEGVKITPLDTAKIVNEALERLSHLEKEHPAEISVSSQWPVALGYAPWVEEVWVNYIGNALMYGGTRPHIELGAHLQANGSDQHQAMARFWVRDDGPGIEVEKQQQLFRLFSRLGVVSTPGHGLGLSIVRRIVTRLGGETGVESEVGKGSLFWFSLPAIDESTSDDADG